MGAGKCTNFLFSIISPVFDCLIIGYTPNFWSSGGVIFIFFMDLPVYVSEIDVDNVKP